MPFPNPNYRAPTSIPISSFPALPSPIAVSLPAPTPIWNTTPQPLPLPQPITGTLFFQPPGVITFNVLVGPGITPVALLAISTTIPVSYAPLYTLDLEGQSTDTAVFATVNQMISDTTATAEELILYTNSITQSYLALQRTEVITILAAPDNYVPDLPRPLANVGWTFEQLGGGERFSLRSWSSFVGYIASLPIQLVRSLFQMVTYLGPFGLFLVWLLIMFGLVVTIEALKLLYHIVVTLLDILIKLIDLLGQYLPTGG
jgi:hypothetical protein